MNSTSPTKPEQPSPRAALHTLGCRLNQAETESLRRGLEAAGYRIVPWGEPAELFVLNSCTVTAQADAKARQALRAVRRACPRARLALVGCYAQTDGEALAREGLADVIVGNQEKMRLPEILADLMDGSANGTAVNGAPEDGFAADGEPLVVRPSISREPFQMTPDFDLGGDTRAALKIQDGCDFMCTFCIIPTARGRARPRRLNNLMEQARAMTGGGAREIVLTGVNLGTFAESGATLVDVVDRLNGLEGLERIRISSIEPTTVEQGLLERMADPTHRLTPYLHLPLQSGSDSILGAMGRRHSAGDWRSFALRALERVPELCLGTDVMAGFPGENDAAFGGTQALLSGLPVAYFHVFPFSVRPGTAAARMTERVPSQVINQRVAALRALSETKRLAFHRRHVGSERTVLFERPSDPSAARGYTDNYIRVEVAHPRPESLRNQLLPVRLLEASATAMAGVTVG